MASSQLLTMANYVAKSIDQNIVERREMLVRTAANIPLALLHNRKKLQKWLVVRNAINPLFSQGMVVLDCRECAG